MAILITCPKSYQIKSNIRAKTKQSVAINMI